MSSYMSKQTIKQVYHSFKIALASENARSKNLWNHFFIHVLETAFVDNTSGLTKPVRSQKSSHRTLRNTITCI